jgi:hypothetical protein
MQTYGIYEQTACCALTTTKLGYGAKPFSWSPDGKEKLPWKAPAFNVGSYASQSGSKTRGCIDIITLAESQRAEMEPALLAEGYVLVKEQMYNHVDAYKKPGEEFHNGGLVSLYIKEEFPHMSPKHPDFPHEEYVVEKNRIRSKKAIDRGEYGMTSR